MENVIRFLNDNPQHVAAFLGGISLMLLAQSLIGLLVKRLPKGGAFYHVSSESFEDKDDARVIAEFEDWLRKERNRKE